MTTTDILTSAADGVLTVTLNRPEKLNAITPAMHLELAATFDRFAKDDALQVCIVTGAGARAFCAGSDLSAFDASSPYPASGYAGLAQRFDCAKPVIAAVNGICLGGGLELALSCDLIVAADSAVFGLPEPKIGLIAIGGGIHRLVRQAGLKPAMELLLTARNFSAAEALALGLVNRVVPPAEVMAAAEDLAAQIAANAPLAVRLTKALAMWGLDQPTLAAAIAGQVDHPLFGEWREAEDTAEGPRAFAEKRKAAWQGR